ncbi:MAG TPA: ABC transporter permease [Bryobacteraceae bacterium]|jgi:putative ABC transport system permease protein|nr:ABC transporter permease [Bryobacteraceae bacterium]
MRTIAHDLVYAWRMLRKSPGFTPTAIAALAVGIGASSAVFSLLDAALLRPLPFRDPARLVALWERPAAYPAGRNTIAPLNYVDWRDQNTVFESIGAAAVSIGTLTGSGAPERVRAYPVTASFFETLGVAPILGRTFLRNEEREKLAVISEGLWQRHFGARRDVLGQALVLDSVPYTVTGVMPASLRLYGNCDLWLPRSLEPGTANRNSHMLRAVARLKPGVTLEQARAEMAVIAERIAAISPNTNKGWGVVVNPLQDDITGSDLRTTTLALFGAVGLLLLLACANVANLTLARGVGRSREIAVRAALGAARPRILSQLLTESLLLSLLGGAAGLLLANFLMDAGAKLLPPGTLPALVVLQLDARVVIFAMTASILTGVLFGLMPAWQASGTNFTEALRSSGRSVTGGTRVRSTLAAVEIALAIVLVSGAGLLLRTLLGLEHVDRGYEPGQVLTLHFQLPQSRYSTKEKAVTFYENVVREAESIPGVRAAALGIDFPMEGWNYGEAFEVAGHPVPNAQRPFAHFQPVSARYFETLGIRMARGRSFNERDTATSTPVAIVNEEFARRFFADVDPLGQRLNISATQVEIVGVIRQIKVQGPTDGASLELYVPTVQSDLTSNGLAIRTDGDPLKFSNAVHAAVGRVDKDLALYAMKTLEEIADDSVARPRFRAVLALTFAIAALAIAALGVYGVLAYAAGQRTREFGIRMALGASPGNVLGLVLKQGAQIAAAGIAIGLGLSLWLAQSLTTLLFGVKPFDPVTFLIAPLVLAVIALAACAIPARRAASVDPAIALHEE